MKKWTTYLIVLLASLAISCGDDDGDSPGSTPNSMSAGGCVLPDDSNSVMTERPFNDDLIFSLEVDGDWVYFSTLDGIYRISVDGGEPELLYEDDLGFILAIWPREDDIVIPGKTMESIPKTGGMPTEIADIGFRPDATLAGSFFLLRQDDFAIGRSVDDQLGSDDPPIVTYFRVDLTDFTSTELFTVVDQGDNASLAINSQGLFFTAAPPGMQTPSTLYRVGPSPGDPVEVSVTDKPERFSVFGATEEHIYVLYNPSPILGFGSFGRVPVDGGPIEELLAGMNSFLPALHGVEGNSNGEVIYAGNWFYWAADGGTTADRLYCHLSDRYAATAWDITDTHIYAAFNNDRTRETSIVKLPLNL